MAPDVIPADLPEVIPVEAPPSERLPALDLLRGIAILAILPANIPFFSGAINHWNMEAVPASTLDRVAHSTALFFFFGKFVTTLSILFGAGLALQAWRAEVEGRPFAVYYLRRMALLFALGAAHGLFLWWGDILASYAIVGTAALLLSRLQPRWWLWIAGGCFLLIAGWFVVVVGASLLLAGNPLAPTATAPTGLPPAFQAWYDWWQERVSSPGQVRLWRDGGLLDMVLDRAIYLLSYAMSFVVMVFWYILGCFLVGMDFMRRGVFHDFEGHRTLIRNLVIAGLAVGIPLQLLTVALYVWAPAEGLYLMLPYSLGGLPMALAYLGLCLWWAHGGRLAWVQHCFQATGRLALSNYILQSVLCNLLFTRFGLRLYGHVGHWEGLALCGGIWAVQIGLSVLWLKVFQIGPVEWLWRSLAEGRLLRVRARPIVVKVIA